MSEQKPHRGPVNILLWYLFLVFVGLPVIVIQMTVNKLRSVWSNINE